MYYNGLGVRKDRSKAKELYGLAAEGDNNARLLLEELELEEKREREGGGGDSHDRDGTGA